MKEKIFKMLKNKKNIYLICSCMLILIVLAFAIGNNNLTAKDNEAIDTENDYVISPLDIKEILLSDTGASIAVNFSDYNSVPMKYNNTKNNGAVDFYEINYQGNEYLTGWIQIFDLKNQGLKTDDACIAYSYKTTNLEKNYGKKIGRTTIIPVYNYNTEKKVLHKKYCLGLSGYGYLWDEDSHVSAHITDESNVYEWVDDKWNYVGK
jgi:hypothetical protein